MTERINLTPAQQQQAITRNERSVKLESQRRNQIQYQLKQVIGKGSYGVVYKAINRKTQKLVAIKEVNYENDDELTDIMSEIDLLKNLNHINIVKYHGFIQKSHNLYIILEYCAHASLKNYISRGNGLPESKAKLYVKQTLNGLNYLHEQGVIHRDIKAANLLLDSNNVVKLADFGVSTKVNTMTMAMTLAGSLNWMAPEIIGNRGASTLSDIWSLGATVLEVLTGNPPFHNLVDINIYYAIENDAFIPPSFISKEAQDFLCTCFQKNMYQRPTAAQLLRHRWVAGESPTNKLELFKESNNELDFQWDYDFKEPLHEPNFLKPSSQNSPTSTTCLPSLAKTRVNYTSVSSVSSSSPALNDIAQGGSDTDWKPCTHHSSKEKKGANIEKANSILDNLGKETLRLSVDELTILFENIDSEDISQSIIHLLRDSSNEQLVISLLEHDKKFNFSNLKKRLISMGGVPSILEYNEIIEQFFLRDSYKVLIQCGILHRTHILRDSIIFELAYKFLDIVDSPKFWCQWCSKHIKVPSLVAALSNRSAQLIILKLSSFPQASSWFHKQFIECILKLPPTTHQPMHVIFKSLTSILIQLHNSTAVEVVAATPSKVPNSTTPSMELINTFLPWMLNFLNDPQFYNKENTSIWKYYMTVLFHATHLNRMLLNQLLDNTKFINLILQLLTNRENSPQLLYVPLSIVMEISIEMTKFRPVLVELSLYFLKFHEEFIVGGLEILLNCLQFALHDTTKFINDTQRLAIEFPSESSTKASVVLTYQDLVDPFFLIKEDNIEFGNFITKFIKICFLTPLAFISFKIASHPDFNKRLTAFFMLYRNSLLIQIDLLKFVKLVISRSFEYLSTLKERDIAGEKIVKKRTETMVSFLNENWNHQIEGQVGCDSILIHQLCKDIESMVSASQYNFAAPTVRRQQSKSRFSLSIQNVDFVSPEGSSN